MTHAQKPEQYESAQSGFTQIYAETNPPWDIGKPQPPFIAIENEIEGPLLDCGCGTGGTAVYFAKRGLAVTGIDFVEEAIARAKTRAAKEGVTVDFQVKDAMTLAQWDKRFVSVIDSGLYHVYEAAQRKAYVQGLAHVLNTNGRLYLFAFAEGPKAPGGGLSRADIAADFAEGWQIEALDFAPSELNPAYEHPEHLDGLQMWFAVIRRIA
ncbi:2-polyprenyl-3-methyl-5-hydroxy-6-metoxy-1,4-benzoquinol methylase [Rhizomicrobium palustre]|uniref:2-polyprenyl-3-methyl-5-hydroxy-6-metoxy-1, 4-benzoquinol methylase n=1 Tax=Rhizomicrobium palustre TaxID=189966 RepID=A0A846N156_9PROT|nr:class I SAM-dependent methyltransferase [Rhizomicrobium palustre]NIK89456.1 2-polyprenyl-3-methyl-5-hydroxy-6-metoxy-1,4-benzoquinol methylase [Rhizomicrobium palustre]